MNTRSLLVRLAAKPLTLIAITLLTANSARSQVVVDGSLDPAYGSTPVSVQVHAASWGGNNTLANCFALQENTKLNLFLGGRVWGNAMVIFIDSKPGGLNTISSSTLSGTGGDNYQVNNFGGATPFTFETGFTADYMIRVYGDGPSAYVNVCDLQAASNVAYAGNAGGSPISSSFITSAQATWNEVTGAFSDVTTGLEAQLDLAKMGVPLASNSSIKIVAMVVNGGSDFAPNQFLGPLPTADLLAGSIKGLNLQTLSGTQTLSIPIAAVADLDGDGIPDSTDPDIDGDGLLNAVETNTGTYVDANNTGTNPLDADSDDDGYNDGAEVTGSSALARVTNPLKKNYATMMVAGNFLTPNWSDAPTSENTMTRVSGQEFAYSLNYNFRSVGTFEGKFLGNSWSQNWGDATPVTPGMAISGGSNLSLVVTATGFYTFSFNHDTLAYSFARTVFPNFASYQAAYGLVGDESADDDNDGLSNGTEFINNTDPTRTNDAVAPVISLNGNALVGVALNASYTDAGATATDNVDSSVTINPTGSVDTSVVGTYTITYNASDAAGNAAVARTRTVIVYDPSVGFASRFTSATVPGDYTSPGVWDVSGGQGNSMTLVDNFKWRLLYTFTSARSVQYKVVGDGATAGWQSPSQWGAGGALGAGNATANVVAGIYAFELDEIANTASLTLVTAAPSALSYTPSSAAGVLGAAITAMNPTVTGTVTTYSVDPALPAGLTLNTATGVISGTPTALSASASYTVTASNSAGSTTTSITISVVSSFDGWATANGLSGANALPTADPDKDGFTNRQEYAFGGNPNGGDAGLLQTSRSGSNLVVTWLQRTDAAAGAYKVKTTEDLNTGFNVDTALNAAVAETADQSSVPAGYVRKEVNFPIGAGRRNFLALAFD